MNRRRFHGDDGSIVLEMAILTPVAIMFLLLVAFAGRTTAARSQVTEAARDAARSASLERTPEGAINAATSSAERSLDEGSYRCATRTVVPQITPASGTVPASISVTVTCDVPVSDLAVIGVGGTTRRISSEAVSVFDVYKAGP